MENVTRPVKDILINCQSKLTKYKPEFQITEFKKPLIDISYIINRSEIYEEVDIVAKVFNVSEDKVSKAGTPYKECSIVDKTNLQCSMKVFGELRNIIENDGVYKFTDVNILLKSNEKILHTTTSSIIQPNNDQEILAIETGSLDLPQEITYEGIVISVDLSTLSLKHLCEKCGIDIELEGGVYHCEHCDVIGTKDSMQTTQNKVTFTFKDLNQATHVFQCDHSILENLTGHTTMNKKKLAIDLCKFPKLKVHVNTLNIVQYIEQ